PPAPPATSTLSLHDALPISTPPNRSPSLSHEDARALVEGIAASAIVLPLTAAVTLRALDAVPRYGLSFWDALIWAAAKENGVSVDRKSTRLNSSHSQISYAV